MSDHPRVIRFAISDSGFEIEFERDGDDKTNAVGFVPEEVIEPVIAAPDRPQAEPPPERLSGYRKLFGDQMPQFSTKA